MFTDFFLSPNGESLRHSTIATLVSSFLLGDSEFKKVCLRYVDMRKNFNRYTYDEWDKITESEVWTFSSGVTPYKDFDDTTNIPIPINNPIIQQISDKAVTSLDLPTWFSPSNPRHWIMILSQDPMPRSNWYDDCRDAVCSSPFGLHGKSWREKVNGGGRIWGLVQNLIRKGIGVYLTDIRKFYFRTPDDASTFIAPTEEIEAIYKSMLSEEIAIVQPDLIVTLGNQSASVLSKMGLSDSIQILNLPHFSGQAQGKIKEYFNVPQNHQFTIEEQIKAYTDNIINKLYE
jgi:hypothetical protein